MVVVPTLAVLLIDQRSSGRRSGLGVLFGAWPLLAFLGYLVAGIWIGNWVLAQLSPGSVRERPYLAAFIGLLLLQLVDPAVPSCSRSCRPSPLLGFGAVLLAGGAR